MSEHNIHSDDEIELKKETAGIDDSVTGINELGSNEAEGNELLMHLPIFTKALRTNTKTTYHQPLHFSYVVQPV